MVLSEIHTTIIRKSSKIKQIPITTLREIWTNTVHITSKSLCRCFETWHLKFLRVASKDPSCRTLDYLKMTIDSTVRLLWQGQDPAKFSYLPRLGRNLRMRSDLLSCQQVSATSILQRVTTIATKLDVKEIWACWLARMRVWRSNLPTFSIKADTKMIWKRAAYRRLNNAIEVVKAIMTQKGRQFLNRSPMSTIIMTLIRKIPP